jgi:prepilin-type N-terminal cleavage/methylation domain-containing protein
MIERYRVVQRERVSGARVDSGFTLIELLIVIVVMGILAAVVIFALGGVSSKSQVAACNTDAKTVVTGVLAFEAGGNSSALLTTAGGSSLLTGTAYGGPYLQGWPSNTGYTISLDSTTAGQVDVTVGGTSHAYAGSTLGTACAGA